VPETPDDAISLGMVKLHHDDARGCSYGGRRFPGTKDGIALVPAEDASDLLARGFVPINQGQCRRHGELGHRRADRFAEV
jgi:hypothetical protein